MKQNFLKFDLFLRTKNLLVQHVSDATSVEQLIFFRVEAVFIKRY